MASVEIAIEEGLEAIEVMTTTTEALETVIAATDTFSLLGETIEGELTSTLESTLETTITEQLSTVISQSIEENVIGSELEQVINESIASEEEAAAIEEETETATSSGKATEGTSSEVDPDSTADEDGKTKESMSTIIGKWANRIFNIYMLTDIIGKMVMKFIDAANASSGDGGSGSQYSADDAETMNELSNSMQKLSIIFSSLKESINAITESTHLLGNETVTENGKTTSVKDVVESILSTINQVRAINRL